MSEDIKPREATEEFDLMVFVGRFQPFHYGHLAVVKNALERAKEVLILVGSSNVARDTRNPFTFDERATLMATVLRNEGIDTKRVMIEGIRDTGGDNQRWIADVQTAVRVSTSPYIERKIALTGNLRDRTSEYLNWFPQWPFVAVDDSAGINATDIRKRLWASEFDPTLDKVCPVSTVEFLKRFWVSDDWWSLKYEREAEIAYKEKWGAKEPHMTVDAVVIQSGHVLVIKRGRYPGMGALALPGGFLEPNESLLQGALRELDEEAGLCGVKEHLRGSTVFDDPNRSRRGRIITHAFTFKLPDGTLPRLVADDDAAEAFWLPISEVRADRMFEDHAFIIQNALKHL